MEREAQRQVAEMKRTPRVKFALCVMVRRSNLSASSRKLKMFRSTSLLRRERLLSAIK